MLRVFSTYFMWKVSFNEVAGTTQGLLRIINVRNYASIKIVMTGISKGYNEDNLIVAYTRFRKLWWQEWCIQLFLPLIILF